MSAYHSNRRRPSRTLPRHNAYFSARRKQRFAEFLPDSEVIKRGGIAESPENCAFRGVCPASVLVYHFHILHINTKLARNEHQCPLVPSGERGRTRHSPCIVHADVVRYLAHADLLAPIALPNRPYPTLIDPIQSRAEARLILQPLREARSQPYTVAYHAEAPIPTPSSFRNICEQIIKRHF